MKQKNMNLEFHERQISLYPTELSFRKKLKSVPGLTVLIAIKSRKPLTPLQLPTTTSRRLPLFVWNRIMHNY